MDAIVCWDGDHIGRQVGRAVLADDVEEVRRVDQAINAGNELWRSLALKVGGNVIEIGGDEGRIMIGAEHLADVPPIARQYAESVGASVSVGIGMRLSEAAKALLVAKLRGGNQITIWDPDMQSEIDEATAKPKSEKDKISDEYLNKGQGVTDKDEHAGFTGSSKGSKIKGTQGDHEEGHETAKAIESAKDEAPASPEMTHAADDFEEQLHGLAQEQSHKDGQDAQAQESHLDEVKNKLVEALTAVRQQMPVVQQIRATAPEVYTSIMSLVQGLVALGREVMGPGRSAEADQEQSKGDPSVQKAEGDLTKSVSQIQPGKRSITGPGHLSFDYSHVLPEAARQAGMSVKVTHVAPSHPIEEHLESELWHNGQPVGNVTGYVRNGASKGLEPHSSLNSEYHGKGLGQAMYEAAYAHAKNVLGISRVEGGVHSEAAHKLHLRLAEKHGFGYHAKASQSKLDRKWGYPYQPYSYAIKDEPEASISDEDIIGPGKGVNFHRPSALDKAALGAQGGAEAGRQHLDLPTGTVKDGAIKVQHADGKKGWKHVQAGLIAGQEADAPFVGQNTHPVSSRAPGSK